MFQAFSAIVQIHSCVGNVPYNRRAAKRTPFAPVEPITPEEEEVPPAHITNLQTFCSPTWEEDEGPEEEVAEEDVVEEEEAPEERRPEEEVAPVRPPESGGPKRTSSRRRRPEEEVAPALSRKLPLAPKPATRRAAADDPRFATTDSPNREAFRILQEISKQVSERFVGSMGKIMKTQNVVGVC
jgi:hypothetical protein